MTLEEYQNKRIFNVSPEPKGDNIDNSGDNDDKIFVIHEHHATRLHWDLRLEIGGVLKSWAVPKDPIDVNSGIRRLAIHVEDHPLDYADFEGTIPKGMYGAGTVEIWDKGVLKIVECTENKISFELDGEKMKGKYTLIRVPRMGEKSWLFIKKA